MDSIPDLQVTFLVHVGREGKDTTIETDLVAQYAKRFVSDNWPGKRFPDMYYDPRGLQTVAALRSNFHPKCLLVDGEEALVTSANFTMAAQKKNVEVGVKIKAPILVARLRTYFLSLVERGDLKRFYLQTGLSLSYDSTLRGFSWIRARLGNRSRSVACALLIGNALSAGPDSERPANSP